MIFLYPYTIFFSCLVNTQKVVGREAKGDEDDSSRGWGVVGAKGLETDVYSCYKGDFSSGRNFDNFGKKFTKCGLGQHKKEETYTLNSAENSQP